MVRAIARAGLLVFWRLEVWNYEVLRSGISRLLNGLWLDAINGPVRNYIHKTDRLYRSVIFGSSGLFIQGLHASMRCYLPQTLSPRHEMASEHCKGIVRGQFVCFWCAKVFWGIFACGDMSLCLFFRCKSILRHFCVLWHVSKRHLWPSSWLQKCLRILLQLNFDYSAGWDATPPWSCHLRLDRSWCLECKVSAQCMRPVRWGITLLFTARSSWNLLIVVFEKILLHLALLLGTRWWGCSFNFL